MILVAHRLSTLLTTDRILLIDEGAVAESGTYNELVEQGGLFAELVESAESGTHTPNAISATEPSITTERQSRGLPSLAARTRCEVRCRSTDADLSARYRSRRRRF